jgi:polyhydroxybutyrate depolymerase
MCVMLGSGCTGSSGDEAASTVSPDPSSSVSPGSTTTVELDDRPFGLHVPRGYDPSNPAGLVVALHGYGGTAEQFSTLLPLVSASEDDGFLVALPEGMPDPGGQQFWNATPACCDFHGADVDDSDYLSRLIDVVTESYAVAPERVYVIGFSNGGFMAHRLACDHADQVSAIVSLAGAQAVDPAACEPARAVSVLEVHGTDDTLISYLGGSLLGQRYPSAPETVEVWRRLNECDGGPGTSGKRLDADGAQPGAETTRTSWSSGCADGSEVALWTIDGGGHVPAYTKELTDAMLGWLEGPASTVD